MKKILLVTALAVVTFTLTTARAQSLVGSGSHLPLNLANAYPPPVVGASYVANGNTSFTGTWSSPAEAPWLGTFNATGPIPAGATASGTTLYNFSGLASGVLLANSYLFFSDLDAGSGSEVITLTAYDSSDLVITTPWLNSTYAEGGTGSGSGGAVAAVDMPGWDWNITTANTYTFNGGTVPGNPNTVFALQNFSDIAMLQVTRNTLNANFAVGAPIDPAPEPSTLALMGIGVASLLGLRRGKKS